MLPDLPSLKRDIQQALDRYFRVQVNARLGIFNEIPKHPMHEGNRTCIVREDGSIDKNGTWRDLGSGGTWQGLGGLGVNGLG